MTDDDMIALLDERHDEAAKLLELFTRDPWGNHAEAKTRLEAMTREVTAAMTAHPDFSVEKCLFFLSRQIGCWPSTQSRNLLEQAARAGGKAAVDWYRKVLSASSAHVNVISEMYGLIVREPVEFSNGVRLVPISELIDTPQARALASKIMAHPVGARDFPAAAILTFRNIAGETDHAAGHKEYLAAIETIRRTVTALTLSEANTPTTGVSWIDFHDADLTASGFGYTWQNATYDGRLPRHPVDIDPAAIEWAEKVLVLRGDVAAKCNFALARLNLARRRQTPGDQAIDGCIAFEALLSDRQPGDLTYKLKLRAARLLGNSYIERKEISRKVGSFYRLRGKVVHGQSTGASEEDRQAAKDGLDLTLAALRKIVLEAQIPDLQALELGPVDEAEEP